MSKMISIFGGIAVAATTLFGMLSMTHHILIPDDENVALVYNKAHELVENIYTIASNIIANLSM